jgi:hypothetical protein
MHQRKMQVTAIHGLCVRDKRQQLDRQRGAVVCRLSRGPTISQCRTTALLRHDIPGHRTMSRDVQCAPLLTASRSDVISVPIQVILLRIVRVVV